jgi:hypothetical protein
MAAGCSSREQGMAQAIPFLSLHGRHFHQCLYYTDAMSRFLRCFVMCLVMLTLPFQGASAAVMAMSMATDEAGMAMPQQHNMPGMQMSGCHDEMSTMSGGMADHQSGHDHGLPGKTKVCGNCCSGVMLDALQMSTPVQLRAGNVYLSWSSLDPEGIVPEGLERPPRLIS